MTPQLGLNYFAGNLFAQPYIVYSTAASVGRIHADYKTSITGTTNPTIDVRQDLSLNPISSGFLALL